MEGALYFSSECVREWFFIQEHVGVDLLLPALDLSTKDTYRYIQSSDGMLLG